MQKLLLDPVPNNQSDYRLYRADNGLLCLLISDPAASDATAVLQLGVGSQAEPEALPGLAHLLEHMLFMGSASYPEAGSFPARIASWGGRFNASTAEQATGYYFAVDAQGLDECLQNLADMLAAPSFIPALVASEREVIDAEFHTRLADDALHEQAALAQACNPAHPLSRFTAGNRDSLVGTPGHLATALHAWHHQYYRAGSMALVIHAPLAPHELLALAERTAAQLPAGSAELTAPPAIFTAAALPAQLEWQSRAAQNDWTLWYPLTDVSQDSLALRWLCEWLNSAAPAGARGYLRERAGLAELAASVEHGAAGQALLRINLQAVSAQAVAGPLLAALDGWLAEIAGLNPDDWPQAERQLLAEQHLSNGPAGQPVSWCRLYATRLLSLAPHRVLDLTGASQPALEQSAWQQLLRQLNPQRRVLACRVSNLANAAARARWTDTPFRLQQLNQLLTRSSTKLGDLAWPLFQALPPAAQGMAGSGCMPGLRRRLLNGIAADRQHTRLAWCWPAGQADMAQQGWLLACWSLQSEALQQWAQHVGIELEWRLAGQLLQLDVSGPEKLLPAFLRELLTALQQPPAAQLLPLISHRQQRWQRERQHALPAYRLLQALDGEEAAELTCDDTRGLWSQLCGTAQVIWLQPQGWPPAECSHMAKLLLNLCPALLKPFNAIADRPAPTARVRASDVRCSHADQAQVLHLYREDSSAEEAACWRLLHHYLADPFFAELRTRQQLGYWVVARLHQQDGRAGLLLLVQSPSKSHAAIEAAISDFLQQQYRVLAAFSAEEVNAQSSQLAHLLAQQQAGSPAHFEASWQDCLWQRENGLAAECAALQALSAEQWQRFVARLPNCSRWHLRSKQG